MSRNRIRRPALVLTALTASVLLVLGVAPAQAAVAEVADAPQSCWYDTDTDTAQCFADTPTMDAAIESRTGLRLVYVVAIFYDGVNYGPRSYTVTTTDASYCGTPHTVDFIAAWNDRASSYQSYLGCQTSVWANAGGTGAATGFAVNMPVMGVMSNVGSSFTIT